MMTGKSGSVIWVVGIMICGGVLGWLRTRHPWHWGAMLGLAFTLMAIYLGGVASAYDLLGKLRFGVTLAIPAFIGGYAGAFVHKLRHHRIHLTGGPENLRFWKAAVLIGFAAGVLSLVADAAGSVPIASMLLLFGAAIAVAYVKPERMWRWIVALSPGLPLATTLRILVEVTRYPASHDLYPLEIGISLMYAVVPVIAGCIVGRVVRTGSISRPPSEHSVYS